MDAASRFVDVGGIRTHYYDAGEGPDVVLLHSGEFSGCAEFSWEHTIDELARHYRVVAPDLLGFGETDKLRDFVSGSARMFKHLAAFLDLLSIGEADFVGSSMGGTFLLREASLPTCRFQIRNLVLASCGGFVPNNAARERTMAYDGTPESMRDLLSVMFGADQSQAEDDEYVARRVAVANAPGAWETVAGARFKPPWMPPRSEFGQPDTIAYEDISPRTLAFVGGRDALREPGYHEVFSRMPDARVVLFEEAGHLVNLEKVAEFNEQTLKFLQGEE